MSYAYSRSTGASSLPSYKSPALQSPTFIDQTWGRIPGAKQWVEDGVAAIGSRRSRDRDVQSSATRIFKRVFTIANAVILVWVWTLWWGERTVFQEHIDACVWDNWEHWVGHTELLAIHRIHSTLSSSPQHLVTKLFQCADLSSPASTCHPASHRICRRSTAR